MKDKELKQKLQKVRDSLGKSNGTVPDDVVQQLKNLTNETKKDQSNSVLTNVKNSIDSDKILSEASQIANSDVVERAIEKTLNSVLNPMKLAFTREVSRYVDAISADKRVTRKIPRTIPKKSIKTLENGRFVPASNEDEKILNPEFKQLLTSGFKPKDIIEYDKTKDRLFPFFATSKRNKTQPPSDSNPFFNLAISIDSPEIGDPNSDYVKNFLGGDEPGERIEEISNFLPKYGSIFIDSFDISPSQIKYAQTDIFSEINLKGELKTNIETKKYLPTNLPNPNWDINYKEQGNKFFLTINNNYKYSKRSGLLPNKLIYRLVGNINDGSLNDNTRKKLDQINKGDKCNVQSNEELFSYLLANKLDGLVDERPNPILTKAEKDDFVKYLKTNHSVLIKSFIEDLFEEVTKNRLLQPFKINNLSEIGLDAGDGEKGNLILLNLLNFIPETSEELRACGKTIHPLNIDEVVKIMKAKFNTIGLQTFPVDNCSPEDEPKNAITEASLLGSAILLVRISVLEYILRNLFVFDELGYNKSLTQNALIKEYISLIVKKDLEDSGVYQEVEEIVENSYDLLKENNIIKQEDEVNSSEIFSNVVNDTSYEHASPEIKTLINAMFRKTMNYVRNLLGSKTTQSRSELDILANNIYDLSNSKNISSKQSNIELKVEDLLKNKVSNISRLDKTAKNSKSFFILERFIQEPNISNNSLNTIENSALLSLQNIKNDRLNSTKSFQDFSNIVSLISKNSSLSQQKILNELQYYIQNTNISSELSTKFDNFFKTTEEEIKSEFSNLKNALSNDISFQDYALIVSLMSKDKTLSQNQILNILGKKIKIATKFSIVLKSNKIHRISKNLNLNIERIRHNENARLKRFLNDTKNVFFYNQTKSVKIKPEKIYSKKSYVFYDCDQEFNQNEIAINHYNSLPIEESFIEIDLNQVFKYGSSYEAIMKSLNEQFQNKKEELINKIEQKTDYQLIIRKTMMADKIINLLSFYSYSALSTEDMETLFTKSKLKLKQLITASKNINNYAFQNDTDLKGGDVAAYEADFQNMGNPNGSGGIDLLQFLITTPILILKGLCNVMDPNIAIASQIVNAASAGLLFPKIDDQGNVQYPGDPFILPTALASMALLPVNMLPPGFGIGPPVTPIPGILFWVLEPLLWKLPFFQNQAAKSSDAKKLKDDPKFRGFNVGSQNFSCDKDQDDI